MPDSMRRVWRRTVWIVVAGLLVGAAGAVVLPVLLHDRVTVISTIGAALAVGGLGGGISLLPVSYAWSGQVQEPISDLPPDGRREVRGRVLRSGPAGSEALPLEERRRAARYARGYVSATPLALARQTSIFAALLGLQLAGKTGRARTPSFSSGGSSSSGSSRSSWWCCSPRS